MEWCFRPGIAKCLSLRIQISSTGTKYYAIHLDKYKIQEFQLNITLFWGKISSTCWQKLWTQNVKCTPVVSGLTVQLPSDICHRMDVSNFLIYPTADSTIMWETPYLVTEICVVISNQYIYLLYHQLWQILAGNWSRSHVREVVFGVLAVCLHFVSHRDKGKLNPKEFDQHSV